MKFLIYYKDGHCNEVCIMRDKTYNVFRYVNLTKGHICTCFFVDMFSAIKDLTKYPTITKIEYHNTIYSIDSFLYTMKTRFCIEDEEED